VPQWMYYNLEESLGTFKVLNHQITIYISQSFVSDSILAATS
jgi:hypothetical protein